ncbi:MAG TPA: hypothetical protein K8V15_11230 [Tessaracoccus flavescens]|uniref:Runt domain-containing protein n=1 Tax=Tessaracoccus flavescens TaxID=399497 RepID=A0A921ESA2_9ACTN|nr:hypothetical protein [Tessaracoccus flavescens]
MTEPKQIATLPPIEEISGDVPRSPRTGEPRRPAVVLVAAVASYLAVAALAFTYGWHWYRAVYPATYPGSSRLVRWIEPDPGKWLSLTLEGALAVALIVAAGAVGVAGFQAWNGWPWSRWMALAGVVLTAGFTAITNDYGYIGLGLAVVVAVLTFLPRTYYQQWRDIRAERTEPYRRPDGIFYGRLPRYR